MPAVARGGGGGAGWAQLELADALISRPDGVLSMGYLRTLRD